MIRSVLIVCLGTNLSGVHTDRSFKRVLPKEYFLPLQLCLAGCQYCDNLSKGTAMPFTRMDIPFSQLTDGEFVCKALFVLQHSRRAAGRSRA
jgi:hypothetical protein